jgi:hypothetical protein
MTSLITPLFSKFLVDDIEEHFASEGNSYITLGRATGTDGIQTKKMLSIVICSVLKR